MKFPSERCVNSWEDLLDDLRGIAKWGGQRRVTNWKIARRTFGRARVVVLEVPTSTKACLSITVDEKLEIDDSQALSLQKLRAEFNLSSNFLFRVLNGDVEEEWQLHLRLLRGFNLSGSQ